MPSFGTTIRAARLGYHWAEGFNCFLRMYLDRKDRIHIEVATRGNIPNTSMGQREYTVWWENENLLHQLQFLRSDRFNPHRYMHVIVDDDGKFVEEITK